MDIWKIIGLKVDEQPEETKQDDIDLEISEVTKQIRMTDPLSDEYSKLSERLKGLYDIKDKKLNTDVPEQTFFQKYGETILRCGFSLLSTVLILRYEDVVGPVHSVLKNKLGRD